MFCKAGDARIRKYDRIEADDVKYITLSPYYEELAYTANGNVYLRDCGQTSTVCDSWSPRFEVVHDLRTVSHLHTPTDNNTASPSTTIYCEPKYFSDLKIIAIIATQRTALLKLNIIFLIALYVIYKHEGNH